MPTPYERYRIRDNGEKLKSLHVWSLLAVLVVFAFQEEDSDPADTGQYDWREDPVKYQGRCACHSLNLRNTRRAAICSATAPANPIGAAAIKVHTDALDCPPP